MKSSKIVFFGNERLSSGFDPHGAPTLERLISNGYNVVAVVANYEVGTSRKARKLEVQTIADKYNIPVLLPKRLQDITQELVSLKADIGVLVAYGKIIPESIISIFRCGIVNIHPSLLPRYRGSTPIEQALLDGLNETGVSLMKLVKAMDAGPIYAQAHLPIAPLESKQQLTNRLLDKGGMMLIEQLPTILNGAANPLEQDNNDATYTPLFTKDIGVVDTTKTAIQLEREVRAYATWPKSRVTLFNQTITIKDARVIKHQIPDALVLTCADNTYLQITTLVAPSGKTISGADFLRGYRRS